MSELHTYIRMHAATITFLSNEKRFSKLSCYQHVYLPHPWVFWTSWLIFTKIGTNIKSLKEIQVLYFVLSFSQ